jgi:hypothetical protein
MLEAKDQTQETTFHAVNKRLPAKADFKILLIIIKSTKYII